MGWNSDRTGERNRHCAAACLISAAALTSCLVFNEPVLMMIAIIIAQMAASGIAPTFWALPTAMLTGSAAAGGIALINAVGNLGGFLGPYVMGVVQDATGSFPLGLLAIATGSVVAGVAVGSRPTIGTSTHITLDVICRHQRPTARCRPETRAVPDIPHAR
jgi:MFS transporter, ACS family, tartrate transporter